MVPVLEEVGYHIVCIQEAGERLSQMSEKWSWFLACQQFVAARLPSRVEYHTGQDLPGKIRWAVFTVHFQPPRVGRERFGVLSLHLNNVHAHKRHAGPDEVARVLAAAAAHCNVDIVCGDLNQARGSGDLAWHDGTLEHLESRDYMPIADYVMECCFIAIARSLTEDEPATPAAFSVYGCL